MKPSVIALAVALLQCAGAPLARGQDGSDLRISVDVSVLRPDGGNRLNTSGHIDPAVTGKPSTFTFSRIAGQCGTGVGAQPFSDLAVAPDGTMKKVYSAWTVQVTPTKRTDDAVTFRVRWIRSRDNGQSSNVGDDAELTLRPGQALTLDLMPQSDGAMRASVPCADGLSLDVRVTYWPEPNQDRRLVVVDLWLLERLADGSERSQPLSLRGLYNRPMPFYFDTVTERTKALDVFGDLQVSPGEKNAEIKITTRSRVIDLKPQQPPAGYPAGRPWPPAHYVGTNSAALQVVPGEVVSVPLAPVGNGKSDADVFASRALSFRIRVRPVR